MVSKRCSTCDEIKPLNQFHRDSTHPDGCSSTCKSCKRLYNQERYRSNSNAILESHRQYRQQNAERIAQSRRDYRQKHLPERKAYNDKWNRENPGRDLARSRKWNQLNPDRVRARSHAYRTQKTVAGGSFTAAEWKALLDYYGGKCLCCGRDDVRLTADHVIPVSKGGTSNIDNIQPLCSSCNSRKHDKTIDYRPDAGLGRWIQRKLFR